MSSQYNHTNILHERYFRITLLILLFAYPISTFITDFLNLQTNILSLASRALQVLVVAFYATFLLLHQRFKVFNQWVYIFVLFWILYGIRLIHDLTYDSNKLGIEPKLYYMFGFVLSFLLTIPLFAPAPIDDKKLEKWVYWIVFFCTLAILNNFLKSDLLFLYRVNANDRLNPISAAYPSGILLVLAFRRLLHKKEKLWFHIPLNVLMISIALFNLAIASTKSVYIFAVLLIIIMIGKLASSGQTKKFMIASSVIFMIVVVIVIYFADYFILSFSRFTEVDNSSDERLIYISGAINQFLESPLWGSFIEEKTMKFYPHNPILESFMALGIFGGILFFIYFIHYAFKTIAMIFRGPLLTITILSFSILIVHFVSGSLTFSSEMWYFTAIISALPSIGNMIQVNPENSFFGGYSQQKQCAS